MVKLELYLYYKQYEILMYQQALKEPKGLKGYINTHQAHLVKCLQNETGKLINNIYFELIIYL